MIFALQRVEFEMRNLNDRFGTPEENLKAARKWEGKKSRQYPFHVYVPTRKEVAILAPAELRAILTGWMCHSPIEIIPSRSQITDVRAILLERKDAEELHDILEMCRNYILYT